MENHGKPDQNLGLSFHPWPLVYNKFLPFLLLCRTSWFLALLFLGVVTNYTGDWKATQHLSTYGHTTRGHSVLARGLRSISAIFLWARNWIETMRRSTRLGHKYGNIKPAAYVHKYWLNTHIQQRLKQCNICAFLMVSVFLWLLLINIIDKWQA